ncbi:MAG: ankyrin repeat domain-containing protein, partial [Bdellovibrionales bacterium]|nr:ankyrin repeat domain-containing protein [Bdellovibrionales bacterium]
MDAAFEGNQKVVEQLLKYGALIDQQDREGMSALHYASREGFTKVVELLIKKGADRHLTNLKEETPLGLARRYQHLAVIDLLD